MCSATSTSSRYFLPYMRWHLICLNLTLSVWDLVGPCTVNIHVCVLVAMYHRTRAASPCWCRTGGPLRRFYCWMPWSRMALETGMMVLGMVGACLGTVTNLINCGSLIVNLCWLSHLWDDISAHVVTKKARGTYLFHPVLMINLTILSTAESKEHYNETYINGIIGEGTLERERGWLYWSVIFGWRETIWSVCVCVSM